MKTRFQTLCVAGLCVSLLLSFGAVVVQAETVAYWRFEDAPGFLKDSGPNNIDLTAVGAIQNILPSTGAGSAFLDPIPQTGDSNDKAAFLDTSFNWFEGADNSAFSFTSGFTIEAFVNRDYAYSSQLAIFKQYDYANNDRNIWFELSKGGGGYNYIMSLRLSSDGVGYEKITSSLAVSNDIDYFTAVACDLENNLVTFYLQDLTNDGELQFETLSCTTSSLHNPSSDFQVGWGGSVDYTVGITLDEVRLSNTALSSNELLVAEIPEPGTFALLATGLIGLLAYAWRKQK